MAIKTEIGFTTPDEITVRGLNLSSEILGKLDFVETLYLVAYNEVPSPELKNMLNTVLVTACDHGLTPSALSARLTYLGAPESLQGAVAAGLLGAGNNFLGTVQNVCETLTQESEGLDAAASDEEVRSYAAEVVKRFRAEKRVLPGLGHPIHVNGDPRIPKLVEISRSNGYFDKHWRLALALGDAMETVIGRKLPLNGAGGCGAMLASMQLDPLFGRGLMLVGRAAGLVAHVLEERVSPTGQEIWDLVLKQDSRNVAPPVKSER